MNYELKAGFNALMTAIVDSEGNVANINIEKGEVYETEDANIVRELDASPFVKHVASKADADKDSK